MKRRLFLQRAAATLAVAALPRRLFGADAPPAAPATTVVAPGAALADATVSIADATPFLYRLGKRNVTIHDPSTIVKCNDEFWVFYTGNGVPSYRSKDLLNWTAGPAILPRGGYDWFADAVPGFYGSNCWAPDCMKFGGQYHLYYAISAFGKNTSAIGLVTNPTLDPADPAYAWTDRGLVIKSVASDNYNTIDPAICLDADGHPWLAFGSFWSGIKLVALDPATGLRLADAPIIALANNGRHATATTEGALADPINKSQIEASYIYPHGGHYYLFTDWGLCCKGLSSTYNIRVGRSDKITGPYLDRDGVDLRADGGTLLLGDGGPLLDTAQYAGAFGGRGRGRGGPPPARVHAFIGPGHAGIIEDAGKFYFSCHYYDGTTPNGQSYLAIRPLTWDAAGWPVVGEWPDPAPRPANPPPPLFGGRRGRGGFGVNPPAASSSAPPASSGQ